MAHNLLTLIGIIGIGLFFILLIFVFPRRKAKEERGKVCIYEERCTANWILKPGIVAGGNIPVARLSFYNDFFVVSLIKPTIVPYSEVKSISWRSQFTSATLTVYDAII